MSREDLLRELLESPSWEALKSALTEKSDSYANLLINGAYSTNDDLIEANRNQAVYEWLRDFLANPESHLLPVRKEEGAGTRVPHAARDLWGMGRIR